MIWRRKCEQRTHGITSPRGAEEHRKISAVSSQSEQCSRSWNVVLLYPCSLLAFVRWKRCRPTGCHTTVFTPHRCSVCMEREQHAMPHVSVWAAIHAEHILARVTNHRVECAERRKRHFQRTGRWKVNGKGRKLYMPNSSSVVREHNSRCQSERARTTERQ